MRKKERMAEGGGVRGGVISRVKGGGTVDERESREMKQVEQEDG